MKTIALAAALACASFTFAMAQATAAQIEQVQAALMQADTGIELPADVTPEQLAEIQALLESSENSANEAAKDTLKLDINKVLGM